MLLGPFVSALSFCIFRVFYTLFTDYAEFIDTINDFPGDFLITILVGYTALFLPIFSGVPGLVPLLLFSLSFASVVEKHKSSKLMTTRGYANNVIVITAWSAVLGSFFFGVFLAGHADGSKKFGSIIVSIVLPASILIGVLVGAKHCKIPNQAHKVSRG